MKKAMQLVHTLITGCFYSSFEGLQPNCATIWFRFNLTTLLRSDFCSRQSIGFLLVPLGSPGYMALVISFGLLRFGDLHTVG